jgi:hypothetical protein
MCDFLSIVILRDGSTVHDEENSHSKAVELAGIKEPNQFQARRFWEWEWNGFGEFRLEKNLRGYDTETPEVVVKTALRLAERLPLALKEGKFLDTEFKNMPSVRARSKNWEGRIVLSDGTQEWRENGVLHRYDGPAIIRPDGTQEWWRDGKLDREDGPAVIYPDGTQEWWRRGKRHRTANGPSVIRADGTQEWWFEGVLHSYDGPAVIRPDGTQEWWINGVRRYGVTRS